jgi:hypothetical protein
MVMKSLVFVTGSSAGRQAQISVRPGSTRVQSPKNLLISSRVRAGNPVRRSSAETARRTVLLT